MITPRFELSQTENQFIAVIRAPYCSLRDLDVSVDEHVFIFVCKPYYLRLNLPGRILENENSNSSFDADFGEFTFKYDKATPKEDFPHLEFITKFLCPKLEVSDANRKIEILTCSDNTDAQEAIESDEKYGFAMRGGYNFNYISSEFSDIFEVNPHENDLKNRKIIRLRKEALHFNAQHYIADLMDGQEIREFSSMAPPWKDAKISEIKFTGEELDFLKDLSNVAYDLTEVQLKHCHNSLIEILFAYCYDKRTTCFEATCESGWTISKLCATFCYFDGFDTPKEALVCVYRRCVVYPLYRSFNLCDTVFNDLKTVLNLGEKFIVKCLIEIYHIFSKGDSNRYILNSLFIKDYITYIMKWEQDSWIKVVNQVFSIKLEKKDLGLGLETLDGDGDFLSKQFGELSLNNSQTLDSDDETISEEDNSRTLDSDSDDSTSSEEQ